GKRGGNGVWEHPDRNASAIKWWKWKQVEHGQHDIDDQCVLEILCDPVTTVLFGNSGAASAPIRHRAIHDVAEERAFGGSRVAKGVRSLLRDLRRLREVQRFAQTRTPPGA